MIICVIIRALVLILNLLQMNCFVCLKIGGVMVWIVGDSMQKGSESLSSFKQALHFKNIGFNIHGYDDLPKKQLLKP